MERSRKIGLLTFTLVALVVAIVTAAVTALLVNIHERKQEQRNPYLKFVEVDDNTVDAAQWGKNWPREYNGYRMTVLPTRTKYGGGSMSEGNLPPQKAERDPWLTRMFAGYAFALDYRDRRGHAYMLKDQEATRRTLERPQPGACLHCHASVMPLYRQKGQAALPNATDAEQVQAGFVEVGKMPYWDALKALTEVSMVNGQKQAHPVSCVDCHSPQTMELRVTRPGFINGIKALKASQGVKDYDPNRDATRQEMRSYVCAQCHVEYYCGPKETLVFPWADGVKGDQIETFYDKHRFPASKDHPEGEKFYDWVHAETGARVYKAQHPEFEVYSQGIHARSGVACADCHMPYKREGALKVSEHWVKSPLLQVNRSCQVCHPYTDKEIIERVETIQDRHYNLMNIAGGALVDMLDAVKAVRKPYDDANREAATAKAKEALANDPAYAKLSPQDQEKKLKETINANLLNMWVAVVDKDPTLQDIAALQRKSQWRLDFVAAENSMGFHAPQELSRLLGESINLSRQAQAKALVLATPRPPSTQPTAAAQ